ncbi:Cytochrome P460 [Filomicrobium insigne]|uniref:Cytochrome P460 n=2 Tax=Filomicrobium insigne TaxID=418854 RepID=A0A1H0T258_9HYPH|nr:Cytochrome P460 [Filomicrobium insigne]
MPARPVAGAIREESMSRKLLGMAIAAIITTTAASANEQRIAFPKDYASDFKNYLSLDRVQNPDQIIRLFANDRALSAAKEDGVLPSGSILVGEIYAAKKDTQGNIITSSLGRRIKDKLLAVAVMEKRTGWGSAFPEELKNGDWDFAIFSPDGKRLNKDLNSCRGCHAPLKDTQHIFSLEHLTK